MQMNLIAQLTAAPPSQPAANNDAPPKENRDRFSKLLSDADTKGGNGQKQSSLKSNESRASALSAQEVNQTQSAAVPTVQGETVKILSAPIGADEAKAMLAKLDAMNQHGEFNQDPAFEQLKEALEQIEAGGEPVEVADLLGELPEMIQAEPEERSNVLQRLMGWVSAAMDKSKEAPVNAMPDGTVQSLQASLFSAGDDAARAAAEAAAQAAHEKERAAHHAATTVVIVPTAQNAAMPEWVRKLGEGEENIAADAINEAIPPLALEEGDEGLPVVRLPGADDVANVKGGKHAIKDFDALLKNAPLPTNDNADVAAGPIITADPTTVAAFSNAPSVHNTSTLNPITVSAHTHLATHTAAAEQVQVAITTMKDDGLRSITMQLEPADLGRVEIKMDTVEGKTNISFLVDKPETLDALSRDARSLERMLQESGVRADAGSMQFNLRQQSQEQAQHGGSDDDDDRVAGVGGTKEEVAALEGVTTKHYTLNVKDGVDIHA